MLAATPIGRVGDAPPRLAEELAGADVVAAEDTRRLKRLCSDLGVTLSGRMVSYFEGNESARTPQLLDALRDGERVLLVTDAGMPSVSDPGYRLVAAAVAEDITVTAVPGPSAVLTALAVSGLPVDRFCFEGFLPRKAGERARRLAGLAAEQRTMVFFEAPHRTEAALAALADAFGDDRPGAVCRELTKTHEEVRRGSLRELAVWAADGIRGEVTLVVQGAAEHTEIGTDPALWRDLVAELETGGMTRKDAILDVARRAGVPKREVYDAVHKQDPGDAGSEEVSEPTRRRAATEEKSGSARNRIRPPAPEPLPHPVADNHCHLDIADAGEGDDWFATRDAIAAAVAVNVTRIVQIGCDLPGARWAVRAAEEHDELVAGVALHPNEAPGLAEAGELDAALDEIERLATSSDRVRVIGETGLDHFRTGPEGRAAQVESFRRHIDLAKRLDKVLMIHDRDAHDEVLRVIDEEGAPDRWVMHCFSGDAAVARACLDRGAHLSFAGDGHVQERRTPPWRAPDHPPGPAPGGDRCALPHPHAVPRPAQRLLPGPAHDAGDGRGARRRPRGAVPGCGHHHDRRFRGLVTRNTLRVQHAA